MIMQNVTAVTLTQSTGYATPSGAGDHSLSPALAALGAVRPTPGLDPPEQTISTNGIESITDRNVELVQGPIRNEINGAFRGVANTDAAGTSSVDSERALIMKMKNVITKSVGVLTYRNEHVCGVAAKGNTRGQLQLKLMVNHDCSQEVRQQLLTDVEFYLQNNVPQWLRDEFTLVIEYGGPIEAL